MGKLDRKYVRLIPTIGLALSEAAWGSSGGVLGSLTAAADGFFLWPVFSLFSPFERPPYFSLHSGE
jgi:hypothetical protein